MRPLELNLTERMILRRARHGQLDKLYARKELWESIQLPFQGSEEPLKRTDAKIRYYEKMLLRDRLVDGVTVVLSRNPKYDFTEKEARVYAGFVVNKVEVDGVLAGNPTDRSLKRYIQTTADRMNSKLVTLASGLKWAQDTDGFDY